jgi:hypothetical protein
LFFQFSRHYRKGEYSFGHRYSIGTVQVCPTTVVSFSVPFITAMSYQWKNDYGIIPGETNMKYSTSAPGNYYVTETDVTGCSFSSSVSTVHNYASAKASITVSGTLVLCNAGSVTFNALKKNSYTYQWYKDGKSISGATSTTYVATQAGAYKYQATTSNGCTKFSATKNVSDCKEQESSVASADKYSIKLYPNPSQGEFNIDFHLTESYSGSAEIILRNSLGQIAVDEYTGISNGVLTYHITLPKETGSGIYFVQLVVNQKKYSSQIVIVR